MGISTVSFAEEKKVVVPMTAEQHIYVKQSISEIYQYLDKSNLPHQEVETAKKMLDSTFKIINQK